MECPKCQKYNNIDVISDCWNCGEHFTEELISIANKKEVIAKVAEEEAAVIAKVAEEEAAVIAKVAEKEAAVIAKVAEKEAAVIAKVAEKEATTGVSSLSSFFLLLIQFVFWVSIAGSVYIMAVISIGTGIMLALGTIISCGLIFIMGDILKNLAEINKKTKA